MKTISPRNASLLALAVLHLGQAYCTKDKFPVTGAYARSLLQDLLGPQKLPQTKALLRWATYCKLCAKME